MNRQEMLLVKLSEECDEVGQRVCKALRFGLEEVQEGQTLTNAERIVEEYLDIVAAVAMLTEEGLISFETSTENYFQRIEDRKKRIEKYLEFSRKCGTLAD